VVSEKNAAQFSGTDYDREESQLLRDTRGMYEWSGLKDQLKGQRKLFSSPFISIHTSKPRGMFPALLFEPFTYAKSQDHWRKSQVDFAVLSARPQAKQILSHKKLISFDCITRRIAREVFSSLCVPFTHNFSNKHNMKSSFASI
jgi:hypothetical protein